MNTSPLNLLVVDNNKLIIDTLSKHLETRFGIRVNVLPFFDAESCMVKIDERSHVLVLDYFLSQEERSSKRGAEAFDLIRRTNPNTRVTMISSDQDASNAVDEILSGTTNYVAEQDRYVQKILRTINRIIVSPIHTVVVSPIKIRIILPIRKIISEYTLRDYLVMFTVAFVSVGSLVVICLKIFR